VPVHNGGVAYSTPRPLAQTHPLPTVSDKDGVNRTQSLRCLDQPGQIRLTNLAEPGAGERAASDGRRPRKPLHIEMLSSQHAECKKGIVSVFAPIIFPVIAVPFGVRSDIRLPASIVQLGTFRKVSQHEVGTRLPVLLYHHIGPSRPGTFPQLTISPKTFERQVRWLARLGYVGIRPSDWLRFLHNRTDLPKKAFLITFDDGYADLAEYALPVLRRYRFGAGVFVVTGKLGGTNAWDEAKGSTPHQLMTADQIRYWATQGIEFGSHSRTHVDLTTITRRELNDEVLGSKNDLMNLLGSPVVSFAYPYGIINRDVYECVSGSFDLAFSPMEDLPFNSLLTDRHLLRRNGVQTGDFLVDVLCHVRWGYKPIQTIRGYLKLRSRLTSTKESIAKLSGKIGRR
jgi:peptidoglycan/xylan/chitin deacetylase (PgdA/CDA1 family)